MPIPIPLLVLGGVAAVGGAAYVYTRSRSAPSDDGGGELLGGSTLLFTPPAPLSAPGAGNWEAGAVPQVTAGSTSLGEALLQQDFNALELGKSTLLSQLASQLMAQLPTGKSALDSWRYSAVLGGVALEQSFFGGAAVNYGITADELSDFNALASLPGTTAAELSQFKEQFFFGSGIGAPQGATGSTATGSTGSDPLDPRLSRGVMGPSGEVFSGRHGLKLLHEGRWS